LGFVKMLAHSRLGKTGHAEDVVQEILARAFARRDQLRSHANFRNWLWSIALNEIRAFYRRDRPTVSLDELTNFDVPDGALSPLAKVEQMETRNRVRASMAKLTKRERATIRLRDIEGMSLPDLAAALHSSESAAKTAHFRARKRLAHMIRVTSGKAVRLAA
jgi:RNA polymerase sigma-70 factor (ECF subfamily)